jgi:formylglycine-generating enzyme required for sulfatase activity
MSGQIFISYRREESRWSAKSLHFRLCRDFASEQIFMDIDAIALGEDFVRTIETTVAKCDVLIAVIGANWLDTKDRRGLRRLDNPEDYVRMEIGTALRRDIRVIPVLVDGALMPWSTDLPEDLRSLVRRNALSITDTSFEGDCQRLVATIKVDLQKAAAKEQQRLEAKQGEKERPEAEQRERGRREAEGSGHEKEERLPQAQLPRPVAPTTAPTQPEADKPSAEAPKVIHPLPPKPSEPEHVNPRPPSPGGIGKKSPSKQITFLAIAAVLVVAGLIYVVTRASHAPPLQTAQVAAVTPSPLVNATLTVEEKAPPTREVTVRPTAPVAVAIPSPSISGKPTKEEIARRALGDTTKEHPWVNSLGKKFVPVAGTEVLFSVWDARVQDFEAFVADTNYDATGGTVSLGKDGWKQRRATWREPGFSQGPTHPVVGVSWDDAKKFCEWLTRREQGSGRLPGGRVYRLPTDTEWSAGVGLQREQGKSPRDKSGKIRLYPWGKEWPPPKGAGNYAGEESKIGQEPSDWLVIEGYNDGYPRTSPVGSFAANASGLYDMGGNVWQWCEDWYDTAEQYRVLRGASWGISNPDALLASCRNNFIPNFRRDGIGFRCVVAPESSR